VTQPPAAEEDAPGSTTRLELAELQIAKLWELFTRAARLDISVEALRDEVRFLTSMWQQIQDNDEALVTTRDEVHAVQRVQREKADEDCVAANRRVQAAITRESALAGTDLPATRAAHRESAAAMSRQLRQCG
jgi:hypothetical protein